MTDSQSQLGYDGERAASAGAEPSAAFTPGPWSMGRMQRSSNFAKDTYAVHGDGTILCKVKGGVTEDAAIAAANARLIAAAPDLLAALKLIADGPRNADLSYVELHHESSQIARAAIAKALGAPAASPADRPAMPRDTNNSNATGAAK